MNRQKKNLLRAVAISVLLGFAVYTVVMDVTSVGGPTGRLTGGAAPEFSLPPVEGDTPVTLAGLRGKGVLLAFWATYCDSCKRELPVLENIHREFAGEDLQVLTVAAQSRADLAGFLRQRGLTLPVLTDGGTVHAQYRVGGIPYTVFIGPDGKVLRDHVGPMSERDLVAAANRLAACARALREGRVAEAWCTPAPQVTPPGRG